MHGNFIDRTGEIGVNNQGLKMWIINYHRWSNIDVQFENDYIAKNVTYQNFQQGSIKNPYFPNIFEVGYIGEGKYKTKFNDENSTQYSHWKDVLRRCYSKEYHLKKPTYYGCSVYEEWHNFQNFAKWFDENYYTVDNELMHIDKDILQKGNKIYSPETCIFVPQTINLLFVKCDKSRGEYPIGVSWITRDKVFRSYFCKNGKNVYVWSYNTSEEAFQKYKVAKEKYIKEVADEYRNKIPKKLYEAMYRYEVEIDD